MQRCGCLWCHCSERQCKLLQTFGSLSAKSFKTAVVLLGHCSLQVHNHLLVILNVLKVWCLSLAVKDFQDDQPDQPDQPDRAYSQRLWMTVICIELLNHGTDLTCWPLCNGSEKGRTKYGDVCFHGIASEKKHYHYRYFAHENTK